MSHNETLKFLCFIDLLDRYFRDLFFTLDLSGGSKDHSSHVRGDRQTDISTRELKSKVAHATATKKKRRKGEMQTSGKIEKWKTRIGVCRNTESICEVKPKRVSVHHVEMKETMFQEE